MSKYKVQVIRQNGKWAGVFDDLERSFTLALKALNIHSEQGQPIVFGANLILSQPVEIPQDAIIFNLEQITASRWLQGAYLDLLKSHEVWDYSDVNRQELAKHDIHAKLCRIGWMEKDTIPDNPHKDIDVLFYGSLNERRKKILRGLQSNDLNVLALYGMYGKERDEYIARSKVVLNVHYYNGGILEPVRLSYLVGNGIMVVSEYGEDHELDRMFFNSASFANYNNIVKYCCDFIKYCQDGFVRISAYHKLRQDILLKEALCL